LRPEGAERDEDLLRRFLEGEERAFTTLMQRHENRIFSLALRITGDRTDALDATQDAFISAFKRASSFRGEAAFSTWLYRIGINSCNDLLRRKGRLPIPRDDEAAEEREAASSPGRSLEEEVVTRVDLTAALAALPMEYREALAMHDLGGVPYEDIATVTGVAVGTVKSRISRGRQKLAKLLEQPAPVRASKEGDGSSD
jgi:RNA polymerase sigma-70 factor (ECF subfamily)